MRLPLVAGRSAEGRRDEVRVEAREVGLDEVRLGATIKTDDLGVFCEQWEA